MKKIESSWYLFYMSLINLQLEHTIYLDQSVKTTLQVPFDVGLFDSFHNKDETFKKFVIFNKRLWGEVETGKQKCHYLLLNLLKN